MNKPLLQTRKLSLVLQSVADIRAMIENMDASERAQISAEWLALVNGSVAPDPWIHGFSLFLRENGVAVGKCGFKGPPADGTVEISYGIAPEHQGKGFATEAAHTLTAFAFSSGEVRTVRAHTLPQANASTRVLTKCGFQHVGEVMDPEDGLVWRWEKHAP